MEGRIPLSVQFEVTISPLIEEKVFRAHMWARLLPLVGKPYSQPAVSEVLRKALSEALEVGQVVDFRIVEHP